MGTLSPDELAYAEFDSESSVVGTNADWPIEVERLRAYGTLPNKRAVGENFNLCTVHFGAKRMRVAGTQHRNRCTVARLTFT